MALNVRVLITLVSALVGVFVLYVQAEGQIAEANQQRFQMRALSAELRQSSDDLTRMVRAYVLTGDERYKKHYQEVLDIRDGKIPRPPHYGQFYWDLVIARQPVPEDHGDEPSITAPLLELIRQAGAPPDELALLAQAKAQSDALTRIEFQAMARVETPGPVSTQQRLQAAQMLLDDTYLQAKAAIMQPINRFLVQSEHRTLDVVDAASGRAALWRALVIVMGLITVTYLVWIHWLLQQTETARRATLAQLERLTRTYAALSETSKAMVRCTSRQELFEMVCRAAVQDGALPTAWIGMLEEDGPPVLRPIAMQGSGLDYVRELHIVVDPQDPRGQGPTGVVLRTGQPYWCQDFMDDERTLPWRDLAQQYGWGGFACLPLRQNGKVVGVLNVYANAKDAFDARVRDLLQEMAADIDYAMAALDQEQARLQAETRLAESELRLQLAYQGTQDALWDWNLETGVLHYSPRWWQMIGLEPDSLPVDGNLWRRVMHPQDLPRITQMLREQMSSRRDSFVAECRLMHRKGHAVPVRVRAFVVRDGQGKPVRVAGTNMDISERVQAEQMESLRGMMLERLTGRTTLVELLDAYARKMEETLDDAMCAVLLYEEDEQALRLGAAPSMPEEYRSLLQRSNVNPKCGPGATAVAYARRVVVADLTVQPYTADYLAFVHRHGFASAWAEPIRAGDTRLLGALVIYRRQARAVLPHEFALVAMAAHITAIAMERKNSESQLLLSDKVFAQGGELIMITDASGRLVRVNQAFTQITGYSEAEALGRNPRMLSSGMQDAAFYAAMWNTIATQGHWQGEVYNRRKGGSLYAEWLSISKLCDAHGEVTHYVAIGSDITQRKQDEEKIRMLADFDPLTGLPNRRLLQDRVATALHVAQRQQEKVTLIFLDLDRFKNVNDSLGHPIGDELLVQVARRLTATVRQQDTVCRMGGDEFVLLCPDTDATGAAHLAGKLQEAICERYLIQGQELSITTSIGLAIYPEDGDSFDTLSMRADTAMYRAKQGGRNGYRFFTAEMQAQSARALQLENGLRRALELQQLSLVYQPQVSMHSGRVLGVEALIRWNHPTLGAVSPAEFIPVAEDSGLILPIGEWVLRTAVQQLRQWRDAGLALDQVAVNLSAVQFRHPDLPLHVARILEDAGLAPQHLELELTEGVALQDPVGAIDIMQRLHGRGVRMSIDDFGTGYSSLSYLKRFHVYKLKIDQSFVRDITEDAEDRAIVEAIIGLARSLGFLTIAEGVETPGQLDYLRAHGCDEVQGYFYSRPLPPDALEAFVRRHQQGLAVPSQLSLAIDH